MSDLSEDAIKNLKVAELKAELTKRGLDVKGKKDELVQRLLESIQEGQEVTAEPEGEEEEKPMEEMSTEETTTEEITTEETTIEETTTEETPVAEEEAKEEPASIEETTEQTTTTTETPAAETKVEDEEESDDEDFEYVCPPEFEERDDMKKIFVGQVDKSITDEQFKELFAEFGEIAEAQLIRKDNPKGDKLFGFVTFTKCDDVEECLLKRPIKFLEKDLDVKRAVPKNQDDPSSGMFRVKKLHVANIPQDFTPKALKSYLKRRHPKKFGTIDHMNFLKVKDEQGNLTEKNRGFGFITVSSEDFADRIAIGESKFTLDGNAMRISKAKPRSANQGYYNNQGWGQGYSNEWGPYGGGYGGYNGGYYGGWDQSAYYGYGQYQGAQRPGRGGHRYNPY